MFSPFFVYKCFEIKIPYAKVKKKYSFFHKGEKAKPVIDRN